MDRNGSTKQLIMKTHFILLFALISTFMSLNAQEDDEFLNELLDEGPGYAESTFKATRIMNGHSIENIAHGELVFRISHRFGRLNEGVYELFGIDQAIIHFSLEYGVTPWLTAGVGRSNFKKTYDGYIKFRVLRQSNHFPLHVSYFASTEAFTLRNANIDYEFRHRLGFVHQALIARKFNNWLSLQLTPTFVHQNLTGSPETENDLVSLGVGGRIKITNRLTLNAEAFLADYENYSNRELHIPLAIGVDLETGGHVFQLMITNAQAMREVGFLTETTGNWLDGDLHFGFNISRVFNIVDY